MSTHDEYMTRRQARDLARRLARLESKTRSTAAAHADLRHSALDQGARIPIKDEQGNTTAYVGSGPTGIEHVDGPVPEQPSAPFVDVGPRVVKVQSSGLDVNENPAPADLKHVEVHVAQDEVFEPSWSTFATNMDTANGSVTHSLPAGEWYVGLLWVTLSGKRSVMSEIVLAVIEPPVDVQDIQDTLDAAESMLDEYRDEVAAPRFQALEEGFVVHETNISDARDRLEAAESTLAPLPGRIEVAEQDVETAKEAAVEAGAAAVEANNRSMTRLANGNFENGLDYWTGVNVSVSDTAHSGVQAASLDHGGGHLSPESSFPVVPDQIWELSLYYRGDVTVAFQSVEADARSTLESFDLDGDATWADSGALRVTVPAGVDMLSFTIAGEDALVDDVTLRDVTDVVRLEEAANANRRAAEDALAEATLIRFAVEGEDGESGLKGELRAAQATLAEKADQSELPALETRLSEAFGADISTALDTAAADATAKANAAQTAAEAKAQELAEAEASAAQSAAEAAAAQDALEKANAARDAAIESASGDATAKANAAKEAAETAAAADAKAKADAAQAEAIRQAKEDATAKADAAKTAAENAAKDYADQQDVILKGEAAADAQAKADAAAEAVETALATVIAGKGTVYTSPDEPEPDPNGVWLRDGVPHVYVDHGEHAHDWVNRAADLANWELFSGAVYRDGMIILEDEDKRAAARSPLIPTDEATTLYGAVLYKTFGYGANQTAPRILFGYRYFDENGGTFPSWPGRSSAGAHAHPEGQWEWTRSGGRFSFIPPEGPKPAFVAIQISLSTAWTGPRAYIAGANFHLNTDPTPSVDFDGETPGFAWQGEPFNSAPEYAGPGWFPYSDPAVREARVLSNAAQARADEAHANAGSAWTHADAAMSRAGAAEANAIEEAGRLATAAREAAEAEADRLAKAEAQAAQSAAEANAAADALAKAEAARDAAIDSASGDATAKADAAKTAAEAAAAADAKAKADAAQAEAIRQAKLDATEKADAAQAAAEQAAKDHADALPKVLHGTGAPAGTAPNGSIWWQHQGALSGPVIGQWNRVNGQWRSTPIDSEAIANLDVGKLTAGSAEIAEAVIDLLWARVVRTGLLEADEALIGGTLLEDGAVTAEKVEASREMITKLFGAEWAYISERLVVEGDLIANHADIISAAIKNLSVTERADLFEAFITTLGAQEAVIDLLITTEAWIGGTMLKDDTVTTQHIEFTETLVGNIAELLHLVVGRMDVNSLWADQTWQAAGHFGSEEADQSTLVDGTGLRITKHDHDDETSTDIVRLGGEGIGLVFADEDGEITGSLSHEGDASFRDVAVETLTHGGRPLQDPACQDYVHPSGNQSLISWRPRAVVGRAETTLPNSVDTPYREYAFLEVAAHLEEGRSYWLKVTPFLTRNATHNSNYLRIRATTDGTHPNGTSPEVMNQRNVVGGNDEDILMHGNMLYTPTVTGVHRFMVSVYTYNGVRMTFGGQVVQFIVEDAGSAVPDGTVIRDTYINHPDGQSDVLGPIQSADSITTEWHAQWLQNYSHNGTTRASTHEDGGGYGTRAPTQGIRPNATNEGRWSSLLGFQQGTNDQTLQQALNGATIQSITLEVRAQGAHNDSNQARFFFYAHNHTTAPAQYTSGGIPLFTEGALAASQPIGVGQTRRFDIPVDQFGALLKTGDFRTLGLRAGSNQAAYSGWLNWSGIRPKLIVSYKK